MVPPDVASTSSGAKHPDVNMCSLTNGAIGCPTVTDMGHFVLPCSMTVGAICRNYMIFKEVWPLGVFLCNLPRMA
jgi:hypothetical protein